MRLERGRSKQGKLKPIVSRKKEYLGSTKGVSFIYNPDLSGNVHVHLNESVCVVPLKDLVDFIVHLTKRAKSGGSRAASTHVK